MRVFLDTNVFVAAVATRGLCADVVRDVLGHHDLIASTDLVGEIGKVLREKLGVPEGIVSDALDLVGESVPLAEPAGETDLPVRDPNDRVLVAAALAGGATLFVTGDRELLALIRIGPMEFVTPRMYWERLRGPSAI
jgi:putative PIN family toxin of toxin-antitoxin system